MTEGSSIESSARVIKGGSIVFLSYIIAGIFNIIFTVSVMRLLGTEGYGTYMIGFALFSFMSSIALLGIPAAIVRHVAKYVAKKDHASALVILRKSMLYLILSSVAFAIAIAVLAGPIASHVYHDVRLTNILIVVALMIPCHVILVGFLGIAQAFQNMKYYLVLQSSWTALRLPISIALILLGFFATGALLGTAIGMVIASVIGFALFLPKLLPKSSRNTGPNLGGEILATAIPVWLAGIGGIVLTWYPILLLGSVTGIGDVGAYSASLSLILFFVLLPRTMAVPLFPVVSEFWTLGEKKKLGSAVRGLLKLIFITLTPFVIGIAIFSGFVLTLIGGGAYAAGSVVFSLFAIMLLFMSLVEINGVILVGIGRSSIYAKIYLVTAILALASITPLASLYGINGVAAGVLVAYMFLALLGMFFVRKLAGLRYFSPAFLKIALGGAVMAMFLVLAHSFVTSMWQAILAGVIGIFIYVIVVLKSGGVEKADVAVLKKISSDFKQPRILTKTIRFLERYAK